MWIYFLAFCLSGDVPVVENGITPSGKAQTLVFTENLRLSGDDGDDYVWPALDTRVAVNSSGHMLVPDQKGNRIMEYGADGKLVRQIGSQGDGPGQFKGLKFIQVLDDDRIAAFDFQQAVSFFNLFDKAGKFIGQKKNIGMEKLLVNVDFAPNYKSLFSVFLTIKQAEGSMDLQTAILAVEDLVVKMQFSNLTQPAFDPTRATDGKYWSERLGDEIKAMASNRGVVGFSRKSEAYSAMSARYEITLHGSDLKPRLIVRKKYKPVAFSEDEQSSLLASIQTRVIDQLPPQIQAVITDAVVKKAIDFAKLSPVMNPVHGVIPMPDGGFLVVSKLSFKTQVATADIFDAKGRFLGSFTHPNNGLVNVFNSYLTRMIFQGKYAYTIESDSEGENSLVRYAYQLKETKK